MKSFKQYIKESLLDKEDELAMSSVRPLVEKFLKENYHLYAGSGYDITEEDGMCVVNAKRGTLMANMDIENLTNGLFRFGFVEEFECINNQKLKSLEGAPRKCDKFVCESCRNLTSLEGGPQECDVFSCEGCISLKNLEGSPEVCRSFHCSYCHKLVDLKGCNAKYIECFGCNGLKSLKGAPNCIHISCQKCKSLKSLECSNKNCTIKN